MVMNHFRKICAKARLLIAKYNDETTNVDVDVNIGYYKESVEVFKQWEKSLVRSFHFLMTIDLISVRWGFGVRV